jgi:hypothetical protein
MGDAPIFLNVGLFGNRATLVRNSGYRCFGHNSTDRAGDRL